MDGPTFVKTMIIQFLNWIITLGMTAAGVWVVAHGVTDATNWATGAGLFTWLAVATVWSRVNNTQWVKDLSNSVSREDTDRMVRVARAMDSSTPMAEIKTIAQGLKDIQAGKPIDPAVAEKIPDAVLPIASPPPNP